MNTRNILATVAIVGALVLGVVNYGKPINVNVAPSNPTPVQVNVPQQAAPVVNVPASTVPPVKVGSVVGPEVIWPYFNTNNVYSVPKMTGFLTSTTTICAVKPGLQVNATTTLDTRRSYLEFRTSSTTASTITIAKASTQYATTTVIATSSISAGAKATILMASTSIIATQAQNTQMFSDLIFSPTEWLVVSMTGGVGTFSPVGKCVTVFNAGI